jgi:hypothetical protein
MKPLPNIGFDRFIARSWLDLALAIAAGEREREELTQLLDQDIIGIEARSKTSVILNRIWLSPHPTLVAYLADGVSIYKSNPNIDTMALHWCMALRSHPLFSSIANSIGRLIKLHGEFTASQILRRIKEQYGDRASVVRATAAVLQTLVAWGVIVQLDPKQRRFRSGTAIPVKEVDIGLWILNAGIYTNGNQVELNESINSIYPLTLPRFTELDISKSNDLFFTRYGSGNLLIGNK